MLVSFARRPIGHDGRVEIHPIKNLFMATFERYALTIGTGASAQKYSLRLSKEVYGSAGVGDALGIKKATDQDNFNGVGSLTDLRRAGLISQIRASGKNSATGKNKSFKLWCVTSQVPNATAKLPEKTINGVNISNAGLILRTRRR